MREIKFRAWDKENKFFWDDEAIAQDFEDFRTFNDYILMQFTGLKDRDGKEIWEGDVISFMQDGSNPQEVYYKDGAFWPLVPFNTETAIIKLGNKYETPELIK